MASLMAGNAVLLKHASNVTISGKLLKRIYREADIPDGLFTTLAISHDQSDDVIKKQTCTSSDVHRKFQVVKDFSIPPPFWKMYSPVSRLTTTSFLAR